jgi:hypothetical protein
MRKRRCSMLSNILQTRHVLSWLTVNKLEMAIFLYQLDVHMFSPYRVLNTRQAEFYLWHPCCPFTLRRYEKERHNTVPSQWGGVFPTFPYRPQPNDETDCPNSRRQRKPHPLDLEKYSSPVCLLHCNIGHYGSIYWHKHNHALFFIIGHKFSTGNPPRQGSFELTLRIR